VAVRKLRAVMEVEEKRAAAVMLLPARAPVRLRSLGMGEKRLLAVNQARETEVPERMKIKMRK